MTRRIFANLTVWKIECHETPVYIKGGDTVIQKQWSYQFRDEVGAMWTYAGQKLPLKQLDIFSCEASLEACRRLRRPKITHMERQDFML